MKSPDPPTTPGQKLTIDWDELNSEQVEQKLRERAEISGTQRHYEKAQLPTPVNAGLSRLAFLRKTWVCLALAGAVFGVLGGAAGLAMQLRHKPAHQLETLLTRHGEILDAVEIGKLEPDEAARAIALLDRQGRAHAEYESLRDAWRAARSDPASAAGADRTPGPDEHPSIVRHRTRLLRETGLDLISYFLAVALLTGLGLVLAEPLVDRNLIGGLIRSAMAVVPLAVVGFAAGLIVAANIMTPTMGLVVAVAAVGMVGGLVLAGIENSRRRLIGGTLGGVVVGGLLGWIVATLTDPRPQASFPELIVWLVMPAVLGLLVGLAAALIDSTRREGWLKVTAGLIAGKQFILYRNPTFIGSAPLSHVYLFKDPAVGRRHAAIHQIPGGYEIENLPLGSATLVNNKPVNRQRLRDGDVIQIGKTAFRFEQSA